MIHHFKNRVSYFNKRWKFCTRICVLLILISFPLYAGSTLQYPNGWNHKLGTLWNAINYASPLSLNLYSCGHGCDFSVFFSFSQKFKLGKNKLI
jgi:hypothetical protein